MMRCKVAGTWALVVVASAVGLLSAPVVDASRGKSRHSTSSTVALLPIDRMRPGETDGVRRIVKGIPSEPIYADGFEAVFVEPPLHGELRFTRSAYSSPAPDGTQIETASQALVNDSGFRFLQADSGLLGRVSPDPLAFENRVEFERMDYTPGGLVEAPITPVDLSLGNPSASTSGCETSDFNGFPVGHIALIQRGACEFRIKAGNAEAAGAVGVIIFNQGTAGKTDLFAGNLFDGYLGTAPVVSTSFALGQQWAAQSGAVFRMRVSSGQRNNAWQLVPIVHASSTEPVYWLRNSETGEVLASRPSDPLGFTPVHALVLDDPAPDDQRAWWQLEGTGNVRFRNLDSNEYLAAMPYGGQIYLVTMLSENIGFNCPGGYDCDHWRLDSRFARPPVGSTRFRSALGDAYLQVGDGVAEVGRVKPGWPSARWVLEPVANTAYRRLRNLQTGDYLHVEYGNLQAGDAPPNWWSAMWELEPAVDISELNSPGDFSTTPMSSPITNATGYYHLKNRWTGQYIIAQGNGLASTENSPTGALRALWVLDDAPIATIPDTNLRASVNALLGQSASADILSSVAAGLYQLNLADAGISNLTGLASFPRLREVRLPGNAITDVTPLAALTELNILDLSRNPLTTIAPLEVSTGLADGDHVILLRTAIGQAAPTDGAPLTARSAVLVPAPGQLALHYTATNQVVDSGGGNPELVDPELASPEANWSIEYDVGQDRFRIRDSSWFDQWGGYLTWDSGNNNLDFGNSNLQPEWRFELVTTGQYRIVNTRLAGPTPYLQICYVDNLDINNNDTANCATATWYFDAAVIQQAKDRAIANYYDPKFTAPAAGFTRIQNTKSREFLNLNGSALGMGQVAEGFQGAQWKLVPVAFDTTYFFAIQNRLSPSQYLYRDAGGAVLAGPLPGTVPNGSSWATVPENQPYLFALDGSTNYFVRPFQDRQQNLRANNGQLSFAAASSGTVWRLDGGVKVPAPASASGFVQLQAATPPLYDTDFSISYRYPMGNAKTLQTLSFTGAGNYVLPADARDIHVQMVCVGCGLGFSDVTIYDKTWDRPPNRCLESRGPFYDPYVGDCDPTQGSLAVFATNAATQVTCEIAALANYIPSAFDQLAIDDIADDLIAGDVDSAQQQLFSQGDLRGPDLSACDPYQAMSFGAGASAGLFSLNAGGSIGVVWGLTSGSGALSYTSTGTSVNGEPRLLSAEAGIAIGVWKDTPKNFKGQAIGFSLQGNRDVSVVMRRLEKAKKIGVGAGVTLWFGCGTGSGPIVSSNLCVIREDSSFLGFSFDFSAGFDISLPFPTPADNLALTFSKTCVPANFNGNDCVVQ